MSFAGIVCEKGKTFGIYAIRVTQQYETGYQEEWHIYRRYSDFHDFYTKVKEKVIIYFTLLILIPFYFYIVLLTMFKQDLYFSYNFGYLQ